MAAGPQSHSNRSAYIVGSRHDEPNDHPFPGRPPHAATCLGARGASLSRLTCRAYSGAGGSGPSLGTLKGLQVAPVNAMFGIPVSGHFIAFGCGRPLSGRLIHFLALGAGLLRFGRESRLATGWHLSRVLTSAIRLIIKLPSRCQFSHAPTANHASGQSGTANRRARASESVQKARLILRMRKPGLWGTIAGLALTTEMCQE